MQRGDSVARTVSMGWLTKTLRAPATPPHAILSSGAAVHTPLINTPRENVCVCRGGGGCRPEHVAPINVGFYGATFPKLKNIHQFSTLIPGKSHLKYLKTPT